MVGIDTEHLSEHVKCFFVVPFTQFQFAGFYLCRNKKRIERKRLFKIRFGVRILPVTSCVSPQEVITESRMSFTYIFGLFNRPA